MKNKLIYPLMVVALIACGGDRKTSDQAANYETVQEGSAPGVTTTIQGPGETVPALTGTNSDTTTAFALSPNALPPATQPTGGTIAGTFPASAYPAAPSAAAGSSTGYRQPSTTTRTAPVPRPAASQPAQQPMYSSAPERREPQQPVQTEPVEPVPPPSSTDNMTTTQQPPPTQTAPPPAEQQRPVKKEKEQEKSKEQEQKPPADDEPQAEETDTAEPPPPPPHAP